jgi:hypothetical protein
MIEPDESGEREPPPEKYEESAPPETSSSAPILLREVFGCVFALAILAGLLLLAMWGYRSLFGPSAPLPVEAGEVRALELHGGGGSEHAGRKCKVYAEWVAVEADGAVVMIPRERVQSLRLTPER